MCVALGLLFTASVLQAAESYEVTTERGVTVTMRDGVTLRADIYRPKADGQFPVLLQRTPYNKSGGVAFALKAAASGYVVVVQDVRGRYTSEGEWYTFKHESDDGYDTVEWAAALPYSNGKVGMWGGSYVGATQMLAAIAHPPHLAGICPVVTASNYHENWTYQGGAFEQWFNQSWTSGLAQDTFNRDRPAKIPMPSAGPGNCRWRTIPCSIFPILQRRRPRPLSLAPVLPGLAGPSYLRPVLEADIDRRTLRRHQCPGASPWLPGTTFFKADRCATTSGSRRTAEVRRHAKVSISSSPLEVTPEAAEKSAKSTLDLRPPSTMKTKLRLKWYDYLFKGVQNEFAGKPVKIFVMGANQWREEDDWPLARAQSTRYFLHSTKGANIAARRWQPFYRGTPIGSRRSLCL